MKLIKNMTFATLALFGAGSAYSQTNIYIAASSGDRNATQLGISHILKSGWHYQGEKGYITSSSGSIKLATGSSTGAWNGTFTYNGTDYPVVIRVSFLGALSGDAAVAGNVQQPFVHTNADGVTYGTSAVKSATATNAVLGTDYDNATADFGFSTVFQATTPFNGSYNGVTYNSLVEEKVGVSPVGFYASPGFPSGQNLTTKLVQQLYTAGNLPLSLITGNSSDSHKYVYALSRDTDSGQRWGLLNEIGLGNGGTITDWSPAITGTTTSAGGVVYGGTANSQAYWPAETKNGIYSPLGGGGYNGGPAIASPLTAVLGINAYQGVYTDESSNTVTLHSDATAGYYIGYLTPSDANPNVLGTAGDVPLANQGVPISFNGVALTTANVQTGKYSLWLYNRIIKRASLTTGLVSGLHDALRDQILNTDAAAAGSIAWDSNFLVHRDIDGGFITLGK